MIWLYFPWIKVKEQDCQSVLKLYDCCNRVQRLQIQLFLVRGVMSAELFWYQRLCELICVQWPRGLRGTRRTWSRDHFFVLTIRDATLERKSSTNPSESSGGVPFTERFLKQKGERGNVPSFFHRAIFFCGRDQVSNCSNNSGGQK